MGVAAMTNNLKEPDDSLDFTTILTNPVLATTQSWMVAEAIESRPGAAAPPRQPAAAAKLNDHFLIGGKAGAEGAAAVRRFQRRSSAAAPVRGAPVLVVDDDLITRKLMERLLVTDGYAVRLAGSRDEFIGAMRQAPQPALILLDVNMPDMDGFSVLTRLRQHAAARNVPVVMVTASAAPEEVARAFSLGADGYLSKPFKVGVVRSLLKEIFGTR